MAWDCDAADVQHACDSEQGAQDLEFCNCAQTSPIETNSMLSMIGSLKGRV